MSEITTMSKGDPIYDEACLFVIKLGTAVHHYGPSAGRLESYLDSVCNGLGYNGVFRSTPSEITFAFSKPDQWWQRIHVAPVPMGGYNMAKLSSVGVLVEELVMGDICVEEASIRLDEIEAMPATWGVWAYGLSFMLVGIGFAGLIQGNWWDIGASAMLSLLVYILVVASEKTKGRLLDSLPFTSAFIAGICATTLKIWLPQINHLIVTLSAIIILIPGFMISAGIIEIVENHIVAGSARLSTGLVYLIKQFTGAWLGISSVSFFWTLVASSNPPINSIFTTLLFVACLFLGLCVAYQTLLKDFVWVLTSCTLAYGTVLVSSQLFSADIGTIFGACIAGVFANLWARSYKRPTSIVLIPAITVLVSGSIGFRGLMGAAIGQPEQGSHQFLQMFIVAIAISAGLIIANTIVRPRVTL